MDENKLIEEINNLKKEKDAIILVHNYQRPEIYKVGDFIGDSLELAKKAAAIENKRRIIFCGVDFMAESAAILNPQKEVYLPIREARCPMAAMVDVDSLKKIQHDYPEAATVTYVNSSADIKAISYICCTSANAVKVVKSLPHREIIFVPDLNLALNVANQVVEKKIIPWEGYCYVHQRFTVDEVNLAKENYPDAKLVAHPECTPEVVKLADAACSTSQMIDYVKNNQADTFIILTEIGMIERLKLEFPQKNFLTITRVCMQMKKNSLLSIRDSLMNLQFRVRVAPKIAENAKKALERMIHLA